MREDQPISSLIGLFRFIKIVNIVYNNQQVANPTNNFNHKMFKPFNIDAYINPRGTLINNETLMWVDLENNDLTIRRSLNKEKMLQEKAVDTYASFLPEFVTMDIKKRLGGKRKRKTQKKGRKEITKRKKQHTKGRKSRK
jgi:hypothetical protein